MAELDPLIRVRKHTIDQKQKFLAELYRQSEELKQKKTDLENQMIKEKQAVDLIGFEMFGYFELFVKAAKEKIAENEDAQKKLEIRIQAAQDDMRDAFAELKKIEMIAEQRKEEEKKEILKKESALMDEIGIESFRRNIEEE